MGFFSMLFGSAPKVDFKTVIGNGALVIDVRTPQEFGSGHVKGAVNIPLSTLPHKLESLKRGKAIVVYCASGARSASAKGLLERNGFSEVYNGGGYHTLMRKLSKEG